MHKKNKSYMLLRNWTVKNVQQQYKI